MSKLILRTVGAAALVALGTATFTGTALAGEGSDNDSASAVGCSASNTQNGNLIPVNVVGDAVNGNNVLSNCPATASAN